MRRFLFSSSSDISSDETLCTSNIKSSQDNFEVSIGNAVSSPNPDAYSKLPALSVSTIEENSNESSSADNCDFGVQQSCSFTNQNFMLCVNEIIARHGTTDAQVKDWLKLMQTAFPERRLPDFKSSRKQKSEHVNSALMNINVCGDGECSTLDLIADLLCVIETNIKAIFENSTARDPRRGIVTPPNLDKQYYKDISSYEFR